MRKKIEFFCFSFEGNQETSRFQKTNHKDVRGAIGLHADVLNVDGLGETDLVEAVACFWVVRVSKREEKQVSICFDFGFASLSLPLLSLSAETQTKNQKNQKTHPRRR